MMIRNIQLISNVESQHPAMRIKHEIEQRLTISANRGVWFSAYGILSEGGDRVLLRKERVTLEQETVQEIFNRMTVFVRDYRSRDAKSHCGVWNLTISELGYYRHVYHGEMTGHICSGEVNMSAFLRQRIPIDRLFLFGDETTNMDSQHYRYLREFEISKKIEGLKTLLHVEPVRESIFYDVLERNGDLNRNYRQHLSSQMVNSELSRIAEADYITSCAVLIMILREERESYGMLKTRVHSGDVQKVIERMIALLERSLDEEQMRPSYAE